jgi:hypothetical protein
VAHHARRPASGRTSPASAEISVVLPAPLGPSRPKNSPLDFQVDPIQRLDTAKAFGDLLNADRSGHDDQPKTPRSVLRQQIGDAVDGGETQQVLRRVQQRKDFPASRAARIQPKTTARQEESISVTGEIESEGISPQ